MVDNTPRPLAYADSTASAALLDLRESLLARGLHLAIAGGHGRFWEVLERAGVAGTLSADAVHPTPSAAVQRMRALYRPRACDGKDAVRTS